MLFSLLLLCFWRSFFVLYISPLLDGADSLQTFSHSIVFSTLLIVSCAYQMLLIWCICALVVWSKRAFLFPDIQKHFFILIFLYVCSFTVSAVDFYNWWEWFSFTFLHLDTPFPFHYLVIFYPVCALSTFVKSFGNGFVDCLQDLPSQIQWHRKQLPCCCLQCIVLVYHTVGMYYGTPVCISSSWEAYLTHWETLPLVCLWRVNFQSLLFSCLYILPPRLGVYGFKGKMLKQIWLGSF